MPRTVTIRTDYSASELRRLAAGSKDANQSRRLLSLAAVLDGMGRADAARIGGMDRQTLRDWVHRFNDQGPDGLKDIRSKGQPARLSPEELAATALTSAYMRRPFPSARILDTATIDPINEGRVVLRLPGTPKDRTAFQKTDTGWKYLVTQKLFDTFAPSTPAQ